MVKCEKCNKTLSLWEVRHYKGKTFCKNCFSIAENEVECSSCHKKIPRYSAKTIGINSLCSQCFSQRINELQKEKTKSRVQYEKPKTMVRCARCTLLMEPKGKVICEKCENDLEILKHTPHMCPKCGKKTIGVKFCPECGTRLYR